MIYFDNITRYVRDGRAVSVAAGPDYASQTSISRTPLNAILRPSERRRHRAQLSRPPDRSRQAPSGHARSRGLGERSAALGQWFRLVDTGMPSGTAVMERLETARSVLSREAQAGSRASLGPALARARGFQRRPASRPAATAFGLADEGAGAGGGARGSASAAISSWCGGRRWRRLCRT